MRSRLASLLLVGLVAVLLAGAPVSAERPSEVIADADANGGVYVAPSMGEFDEEQIASIISRTQIEGVRLLVIAPQEAEPDSEAFALRVRQAADTDAVLLFDAEGTAWASVAADYDDGFVRALAAARAAPSPEEAAEAFVQQLLIEPERPLPEIISTVIRWTIYLLVALGLAAVAEQILRRRRQLARQSRQEVNEAS